MRQQTTQQASATTTWTVDPAHTSVAFAVRHLMIATVRGRFARFEGRLTGQADDPAGARVEGSIDVASVDTGASDRDNHLRSADFFDAANHPRMAFRSTRVAAKGDEWLVEGELTIRGTTRPVTLLVTKEGEARDPWGKRRVAIRATTTIDRREFGLTWNVALEAGGVLVGDKVAVTIEAQLVEDTGA